MFSGNKGQLNDTPDVHYFKLPYIARFSSIILRMNVGNFAKNLGKKILKLS